MELDAVAPLPIVSDPFWVEFNSWRVSCSDDYNQWVDRNQPGKTPEQEVDNEPGIEQPQMEPAPVLGSAQYVEINKTRKKITKIPQIHRPPENLSVFCNEFNVSYAHRRFFEVGVWIWPSAKHTFRARWSKTTPIITKYINKLLEQGIIEKSVRERHVAAVFAIPKADGEVRLIIDYSNLTPFLRPPPFYLPSVYQILQRQQLNVRQPFFIKIDLANAFFNIPIHKASRYITTYNKKYYRFTKMPFGLSLAPFVMQIMANYIAAAFRQYGIYSWVHIDDLIAAHDDQALLGVATRDIVARLTRSQIKLNPYKSIIVPS